MLTLAKRRWALLESNPLRNASHPAGNRAAHRWGAARPVAGRDAALLLVMFSHELRVTEAVLRKDISLRLELGIVLGDLEETGRLRVSSPASRSFAPE
jgi:hypothetical protein